MQTSSAAAKRVFSLLDASFNAKKNNLMEDYIIIIVVNVKKLFFFYQNRNLCEA